MLLKSTSLFSKGRQHETKTGNVFVKMTPTIAQQILFNTATSDDAIFTACSTHIDNMSKSPNPSEYDYMTGWPPSFEDE